MAVLPFRWQGSSRLEQLQSLLSARTREWVRGWAVAPDSVECSIELHASDSAERRAHDRWFEVAGQVGTLYVCIPAVGLEQLGCRLAGIGNGDGAGLASGVGRRAFADLLQILTGTAVAPTLQDGPAPSASLVAARSGVAGLLVVIAGVRIALYLEARLCEALVPRQGQTIGGLTKRAEAVLPEEVTLTAVLDLGQVLLENTVMLQPGEIIKTKAQIGGSVLLQTESGDTVAAGVLAAANGHRALRCERITRG